MAAWISEYYPAIIVCAFFGIAVAVALISVIRSKIKKKSICCGDCHSCGRCPSCNKK